LLAIHTVPASRRVRRHNPSPEGPQAVDVYAPAGSRILAPLPGRVSVTSCPDTASLPGCQIRGFLRLPDGRLVSFVLAHLQRGSFPPPGTFFQKGEILGRMALWEQQPNSTHVHWAFRNPGDSRMPPPANIPVVRAFELCGPAPKRFAKALEVMEIDAEELLEIDANESEDFEHGDIEILDEDFEDDAEAFEHVPPERLIEEIE
jgi:hypothetical protein